MTYTVVWAQGPNRSWLPFGPTPLSGRKSPQAANQLDRELRRDPVSASESRPDGKRIAYSLPLGVKLRIFEADRLVRVLGVWTCSRPKR